VLGKAAVHAEQVAGEQRRFVAAGAGTDLQEHVGSVVGVPRQQQGLQALLFGFDQGAEASASSWPAPHLRVVVFGQLAALALELRSSAVTRS
jgi:hypothetical protein